MERRRHRRGAARLASGGGGACGGRTGRAADGGAVAVVGPFEIDDLDALVLQPEDGEGLVRGLEYSASYSGTADLDDLHHWTLVPVDPIGEAGFVTAEGSLFMTPEFLSSFAGEGQDLLTAAILFETPDGARRAYRVFASSRDRVWEEWRPLPMKHGRGQEGLLGSDNVSVVYPTVGFMGRVGNVVVLTGSQGGSEGGKPLPAALVRVLTVELLARARTTLRGG